jgi:hypothetical protein
MRATTDGVRAIHRFGLGPRPDGARVIPSRPARQAACRNRVADWPGLRERGLYERRDLKPTSDLRAILKGLMADHLDIPRRALDTDVFRGSEGHRPYPGLVA